MDEAANVRPICRPRCPALHELPRLVGAYGIPVPAAVTCTTCEQAIEAAAALGYPMVLKGIVTGVTHKTDLGLVKTGAARLRLP